MARENWLFDKAGRYLARVAPWVGLALYGGAVMAAPPTSPAGLTLGARAGYNLLSWARPAGGEPASYRVYRSLGAGGPYTPAGTITAPGASQYVDSDVANGTRYYYIVRAGAKDGTEGPSSPELTAVADTMPPAVSLGSLREARSFPGRGPQTIGGTAVDSASGLDGVDVGIRRNDTREWWTGTEWNGGGKPVFHRVPASGAGLPARWSFDASSVMWSQGTSYMICAGARDRAGFEAPCATTATIYVASPAALTVSTAAAPGEVSAGQAMSITMLVANTGGSDALDVRPGKLTVNGTGKAQEKAAPRSVEKAVLAPGQFATFSWTYVVLEPGALEFTGGAAGRDAATSTDVASLPATSNVVMARAPARLGVAIAATPANVRTGMPFKVVMRVTNTGEAEARVTSVVLKPARTEMVGYIAGPDPAPPFFLKGGESRELAWSASASGNGTLSFNGSAVGIDQTSGAAADSRAAVSPPLGIAGAPASVRLVAPAGAAPVGSTVMLTASVRDGQGVPVPGAPVAFSVMAGRAVLVDTTGVTDDDGDAQAQVVMPGKPGLITVGGRVGSLLSSVAVEAILPGGIEQILSRNFFDPTRGETVETRVSIPRSGKVEVKVYSHQGVLVSVVAATSVDTGGVSSFTWDGRDSSGQYVPAGHYLMMVMAGDSAVTRGVYVIRR